MEDYIKTLLEQVRCQKAHPAIERELRGHIEEQAMANMESGMQKEEAMRQAIRDMGDPVKAGVDLDRIHRPQMAWDVVGVMFLIALASIFIHIVIGMGAEEINSQPQGEYIGLAIGYTAAGFAAMMLIYRVDYSIFAKRGKLCAGIFLVFMTTAALIYRIKLPGAPLFFQNGGIRFWAAYVMFLYIPLYGAVLYQYYGSGWGGLIKSVLFLLYPVWLAYKMPRMSLALLLLLIMSVMLSAAVVKGWFDIPKKSFLAVYWAALAAMPAAWVYWVLNGALGYQKVRIMAFLGLSPHEGSYVTELLTGYLKGGRLFGGSGEAVPGILPDYYSDYILTFLVTSFGIAAACAVCLLVAVVAVKAFRISLGLRNRLGMMMGLGSGLVLFANTTLNVLENLGALPATTSFLPFFSYTGTGILVSYVLMGIVLSVYRYKNVPLLCSAEKGYGVM